MQTLEPRSLAAVFPNYVSHQLQFHFILQHICVAAALSVAYFRWQSTATSRNGVTPEHMALIPGVKSVGLPPLGSAGVVMVGYKAVVAGREDRESAYLIGECT